MISLSRDVHAAAAPAKVGRWRTVLRLASVAVFVFGVLTAVVQSGEFRAADIHDFSGSPRHTSVQSVAPGAEVWSW